MKYENKIISLSNNIQYVVLKELDYEEKKYLLANEISNNELGDSVSLFRVDEINGEDKIIEESNLDKAQIILTEMTKD